MNPAVLKHVGADRRKCASDSRRLAAINHVLNWMVEDPQGWDFDLEEADLGWSEVRRWREEFGHLTTTDMVLGAFSCSDRGWTRMEELIEEARKEMFPAEPRPEACRRLHGPWQQAPAGSLIRTLAVLLHEHPESWLQADLGLMEERIPREELIAWRFVEKDTDAFYDVHRLLVHELEKIDPEAKSFGLTFPGRTLLTVIRFGSNQAKVLFKLRFC